MYIPILIIYTPMQWFMHIYTDLWCDLPASFTNPFHAGLALLTELWKALALPAELQKALALPAALLKIKAMPSRRGNPFLASGPFAPVSPCRQGQKGQKGGM